MKLSELNAVIGQAVNIGRADLASKNANIAVARVVQHNEYDIWQFVGNRS